MKRILLIICLSLFSSTLWAQDSFKSNNDKINTFFDTYRDCQDITIIEIGSSMTNMLASVLQLSSDTDGDDVELLSSIKSMNIMVERQEGKGILYDDILELPKLCDGFDLITSINQSGEISNFYFVTHNDTKDKICEFLMLVRQKDQRVILYITGNFSVSDISSLSAIGDCLK
ncbi:MAG: DUF4252 domain-containing protein [Rikenellaceae bacterium]